MRVAPYSSELLLCEWIRSVRPSYDQPSRRDNRWVGAHPNTMPKRPMFFALVPSPLWLSGPAAASGAAAVSMPSGAAVPYSQPAVSVAAGFATSSLAMSTSPRRFDAPPRPGKKKKALILEFFALQEHQENINNLIIARLRTFTHLVFCKW